MLFFFVYATSFDLAFCDLHFRADAVIFAMALETLKRTRVDEDNDIANGSADEQDK